MSDSHIESILEATKAFNNHIKKGQCSTPTKTKKCHTCDICNKTLSSKCMFNEHLVRHGVKKGRTSCDICHKSFFLHSTLNEHKKTHIKNKDKHICGICGKEYSTKPLLKEHTTAHYPSKIRFPCEFPSCDKGFYYIYNLKKHMDGTHIEKYKCNWCHKSFSSKFILQKHLKKCHVNECVLCHKRFTTKRELNLHKKSKAHLDNLTRHGNDTTDTAYHTASTLLSDDACF